jgi:hypothetical protein
MAAHTRTVGLGVLFGLALAVASTAITGITESAALSCPTPDCVRGVPPATAGHRTIQLASCTNPKCLNGSPPATARYQTM